MYSYLDGLTSADVAFEASGETVEEMFSEAGIALLGVMVRDPSKIEHKKKTKIKKKAENIEKLLFDFLDELIFLKDAKQMFYSKFDININEKKENEKTILELDAVAYGERINPKKHDIVIDAKAVTMHHFKVQKTDKGWKCQVIIDV